MEDLYLLVEEKWMKRDKFSTFIAAIDKLPSPKEINIALFQINDFINVYKNLFENHNTRWMK